MANPKDDADMQKVVVPIKDVEMTDALAKLSLKEEEGKGGRSMGDMRLALFLSCFELLQDEATYPAQPMIMRAFLPCLLPALYGEEYATRKERLEAAYGKYSTALTCLGHRRIGKTYAIAMIEACMLHTVGGHGVIFAHMAWNGEEIVDAVCACLRKLPGGAAHISERRPNSVVTRGPMPGRFDAHVAGAGLWTPRPRGVLTWTRTYTDEPGYLDTAVDDRFFLDVLHPLMSVNGTAHLLCGSPAPARPCVFSALITAKTKEGDVVIPHLCLQRDGHPETNTCTKRPAILMQVASNTRQIAWHEHPLKLCNTLQRRS